MTESRQAELTDESAAAGGVTDALREAARIEVFRVGILGLNAWLVLLVLPMSFAGIRTLAAPALVVLPLLALGLGTGALVAFRRAAPWLLLAAYPAALAIVAAALPSFVAQEPWAPFGMLLGVLSLLAYGARAALATGRPDRLRASTPRPLGSIPPLRETPGRARMQKVVLGVTGAGALAIAALAPPLASRSELEPAWGAAASDAAILVAVVAGAVAAVAIGLVVAPATRADRTRPPSTRQVRRRVVALLLAVTMGMIALYVVGMSGFER